jgi:biotin carboxyl carrier protein
MFVLVGAAAIVAGVYFTREAWLPLLERGGGADAQRAETPPPADKVILNALAQKNLGLTSVPIKSQTFWKTVQIPGIVVDRPGKSDRGIVAPGTAVVTKIHHVPGDTVRVGDPLFSLKLVSETLHATQADLFKATQDIVLAEAEKRRLMAAPETVPEAKIIEVANQIKRLNVTVRADREELLARGLTRDQIDGVAEGKLLHAIDIVTPPIAAESEPLRPASNGSAPTDVAYEVQDLKVDLGQQVQSGQTLCILANHQQLCVEGRAFRDETPLLERSVRERWPVEIDFQEERTADWPDLKQTFLVDHLANSVDPVNRTFAFRIPLENQSRAVMFDGRTQLLWHFRPGQKVRIQVRTEKLDNVFVVPADAVAIEGADAFVFLQNDNTFQRKPVQVLLRDRNHVVLANDGSLVPGSFVAQTAAVQLSRMVKAGTGSGGATKGYHIHADGSLHKNEDEGK